MITDIQRFSLNDGPGIRTTVFFKGCPLECKWCHNPEALRVKPQLMTYPSQCMGCAACVRACPVGARSMRDGSIRYDRALCLDCGQCADVCFTGALALSGAQPTTERLMEEILKDKPYYDRSGGGVTISGGEAFMQPELLMDIARACRESGVCTAVETCLSAPWAVVSRALSCVDLFMVDVKLLDEAEHIFWTGASNALILENLDRLADTEIPLIIRTPVIPGVNDSEEIISSIARRIAPMKGVRYYELLNYNPLGESKYDALGIEYFFKGAKPLSGEQMEELKRAAEGMGFPVRIG